VIFGKAAAWQVREILHTSLPENLAMIRESIEFLRRQQKEVIFDAEHFFDGYAENPAYALAVLTAAQTGGAAIITLCDTNGGTLPTPISHITRTVVEKFSTLSIGIHAHNDAGCAIANSLVAIEAGATHAHGTFNGIGERCGNADLVAIIAGVTLKKRRRCDGDLRRLHATATTLAEIANAKISPHAPYIGSGAFAHKAGMHAAAVRKNPASFEHVDPAAIGNRRRFVISELAGRELVIEKIKDLAPELNRRSAAVKTILAKLKEREFAGYQYEAADASFALLVKSVLGQRQKFFSLLRYKTSGEFPAPENETPATAMVKIEVEGKMEMTAASGYGPVHALDLALRKALTVFYPQIGRVRLTDYKVRVLDENAATAAVTRVLIESSDGAKVWNTVGVSADIIEASMLALLDAINYKLEMG
jgi:2-isopropylmalate synthase